MSEDSEQTSKRHVISGRGRRACFRFVGWLWGDALLRHVPIIVPDWLSRALMLVGAFVMLGLVYPEIRSGFRRAVRQLRTAKGTAHCVDAGAVEFNFRVAALAPSARCHVTVRSARRKYRWWGPIVRNRRNGR